MKFLHKQTYFKVKKQKVYKSRNFEIVLLFFFFNFLLIVFILPLFITSITVGDILIIFCIQSRAIGMPRIKIAQLNLIVSTMTDRTNWMGHQSAPFWVPHWVWTSLNFLFLSLLTIYDRSWAGSLVIIWGLMLVWGRGRCHIASNRWAGRF